MEPRKRMRVIVIGAGVTGLTLSHALTRAKIDHVVLERADVAPPLGSSIGIHPHGCRILDQLGCLQEVEELCTPMKHFINRLPTGRLLTCSDFFDFIAERHGYHFLNVERRTFLQAMFDRLPEKNVVKPHHLVTEIIESEDGVRAILANGTEEQGDVIVGCDGVNSIVRQAMWANANKMMPGFITLAEKRTLRTTYSCLLGMAPTPIGLGTRDMTCVHEHGFSFLFLTQPNHIYFFVFSKLAKQLQCPESRRWTDKDAESVAEKVRHHPISDNLLFGELWRTRIRGQLVSVEEGIFDHWHFGRSVLVGDAAHKMTPNFALGGNTGMESVAVLTNELHRLARTRPSGRPTQQAITAAFQRYQRLRSARVRKIHFVSGFITRLQAFDGVLMRFTARYVVPLLIGDRRIADQLGYLVRDSPKLDFIPLVSRKGTMAWNDERRDLLSEDDPRQKKKVILQQSLVVTAACMLILTCMWWWSWWRRQASE